MPILTKDMEAAPPPPRRRFRGLPVLALAAALLSLVLLPYYLPNFDARKHLEEAAAYAEAQAAVSDRRWDDAERLLLQFLDQFPNSERIGNAAYRLGATYLEIAARETPPTLAYLQLARRHLKVAAEHDVPLPMLGGQVKRLISGYIAADRLPLAWEAVEELCAPQPEALARLRRYLPLIQERARLASQLADAQRVSDDDAVRRRAAAVATEARRLADEAAGLAVSTSDRIATRRLQAEVAERAGDGAETRAAIGRLLALHTETVPVLDNAQLADARLLRGRAAAAQGDLAAALEDFDVAIELASPRSPVRHEALYRAAKTNQTLGRGEPDLLTPSADPLPDGRCPATHPVRLAGRCWSRRGAAEAMYRELLAPGTPSAPVARLELAWIALERRRPLDALDELEGAAGDAGLAEQARRFGVAPEAVFRRVAPLREDPALQEDATQERMARILGRFADRFAPETAFRTAEARAHEALAARADADAAVPDIPPSAVEKARARARERRRLAGGRWALLARQEATRPTAERLELAWAASRNLFAARAYADAARVYAEICTWSVDDPRRSEAFYREGLCLQRLGEYAEAAHLHQQNIDAYPDSPAWTLPSRLEQALCWLALGRTDEERGAFTGRAQRRLEELLHDDRVLTPESTVWKLALFHSGRLEAELRRRDVAEGRGQGEAERAHLVAARGHLTDFLRRYAPQAFARPVGGPAALPPHPYAVPVARLLGALEQGERRYAEARAAYDIAIALGADATPPDDEEDPVFVRWGHDEDPMLAHWPRDLTKAFFARGDCFLGEALGRAAAGARAEADPLFRQAEAAYTAALERYDLTPERLIGYLGRARCRIAREDAAGARADLRQATWSLEQFRGRYDREAAGAPGLKAGDVWRREIQSVDAQLAALERRLGLARAGGAGK